MIGWYIGIIGILIGIVGGFFFFRAMVDMTGELKKSLGCLVVASVIYVIFSSIMVIFVLIGYELTNIWWQIVPVLYFISAIFFVVGANTLVKLLKKIQKKV